FAHRQPRGSAVRKAGSQPLVIQSARDSQRTVKVERKVICQSLHVVTNRSEWREVDTRSHRVLRGGRKVEKNRIGREHGLGSTKFSGGSKSIAVDARQRPRLRNSEHEQVVFNSPEEIESRTVPHLRF